MFIVGLSNEDITSKGHLQKAQAIEELLKKNGFLFSQDPKLTRLSQDFIFGGKVFDEFSERVKQLRGERELAVEKAGLVLTDLETYVDIKVKQIKSDREMPLFKMFPGSDNPKKVVEWYGCVLDKLLSVNGMTREDLKDEAKLNEFLALVSKPLVNAYLDFIYLDNKDALVADGKMFKPGDIVHFAKDYSGDYCTETHSTNCKFISNDETIVKLNGEYPTLSLGIYESWYNFPKKTFETHCSNLYDNNPFHLYFNSLK